MHALMQDRHDADVAIAEPPPVDEVPLVSEEVTVNAELGRYRASTSPHGVSILPKASNSPVM